MPHKSARWTGNPRPHSRLCWPLSLCILPLRRANLWWYIIPIPVSGAFIYHATLTHITVANPVAPTDSSCSRPKASREAELPGNLTPRCITVGSHLHLLGFGFFSCCFVFGFWVLVVLFCFWNRNPHQTSYPPTFSVAMDELIFLIHLYHSSAEITGMCHLAQFTWHLWRNMGPHVC